MVAVLCASTPSVYDKLDCEVYNAARDAYSFRGGMPVVAHPPCGQWGRLRHLAHENVLERELGPFCVESVRANGGVLEHPAASRLFPYMKMPSPSQRPDEFGGFTLSVDQKWWGHPCVKPTWLYVVGSRMAVPEMPFNMDVARRTVESLSSVRRADTPLEFARWLLLLSRACAVSHARAL